MKIPHYNSVLPACLGKNLGRESGTAQERNLNKNQLSENFGYLMICLILFQTNEPLAILRTYDETEKSELLTAIYMEMKTFL